MTPELRANDERLHDRVPVMCGEWCIELAGPERRAMLLRSPNVREVRRHKSGELFQLEVTTQGNDERMPARLGNPRRYSHDHETDDNPARNWMLRHLFGGRDIYQRPALDCITTGSRPNPTAR